MNHACNVKEDDSVCILTFHGLGTPINVLPEGEDHYWIEQSFFEAILDVVKDRHDVQITFDDSNFSDFTVALPSLLQRNLRATFFVVSERIDQRGFLTAQQVRALVDAGMAVGSHGARHRRWSQLGAADLHKELSVSRRTLEDLLSSTVKKAACPFGSYNRRVLNGLREAGYERVYTSDQGRATRDAWLSPRNTVMRSHTLCQVQNAINSRAHPLPAAIRIVKLAMKRWR